MNTSKNIRVAIFNDGLPDCVFDRPWPRSEPKCVFDSIIIDRTLFIYPLLWPNRSIQFLPAAGKGDAGGGSVRRDGAPGGKRERCTQGMVESDGRHVAGERPAPVETGVQRVGAIHTGAVMCRASIRKRTATTQPPRPQNSRSEESH